MGSVSEYLEVAHFVFLNSEVIVVILHQQSMGLPTNTQQVEKRGLFMQVELAVEIGDTDAYSRQRVWIVPVSMWETLKKKERLPVVTDEMAV